MDEVLSNYEWFFGIIYAFIYAVLYEMYADKVLFFIPKSKLEKWNESWRNALRTYSKSNIDTICRYLGLIQLLLICVGGILGYCKFDTGVMYIFFAMIIVAIIVGAKKGFDKSCEMLFSFGTWEIVFITLAVFILILNLKAECFFYGIEDDTVVRYATGATIALGALKISLVVFFGFVLLIIKGSQVFTKLLVKKEKVAEYCLTYIFIALLSLFMSMGANKLIYYMWRIACETFQEYCTSYFC